MQTAGDPAGHRRYAEPDLSSQRARHVDYAARYKSTACCNDELQALSRQRDASELPLKIYLADDDLTRHRSQRCCDDTDYNCFHASEKRAPAQATCSCTRVYRSCPQSLSQGETTLEPVVSKLERFVLYETQPHMYLVGCDKLESQYR